MNGLPGSRRVTVSLSITNLGCAERDTILGQKLQGLSGEASIGLSLIDQQAGLKPLIDSRHILNHLANRHARPKIRG